MVNAIYCWIWFKCEFWLKPEERRPFTYIMRDIYHQTPILAIIAISAIAYTFGYFNFLSWKYFLGIFVGGLLTHLFWARYKKGQQEKPTYNPEREA